MPILYYKYEIVGDVPNEEGLTQFYEFFCSIFYQNRTKKKKNK